MGPPCGPFHHFCEPFLSARLAGWYIENFSPTCLLRVWDWGIVATEQRIDDSRLRTSSPSTVLTRLYPSLLSSGTTPTLVPLTVLASFQSSIEAEWKDSQRREVVSRHLLEPAHRLREYLLREHDYWSGPTSIYIMQSAQCALRLPRVRRSANERRTSKTNRHADS